MLDGGEGESFYKQLLLQAAEADNIDDLGLQQTPKGELLLPKPGFCIKTKTDKDEKVFINLCHADNIPAPKHLSDDDLLKLLDAEDQSGYKVPMSLGEPHVELDNNGSGCTVYDVVVNTQFYEELMKRDILLGFVLTVLIEGLEYKYDIALTRDWKMLKNRKFMGEIKGQNIRTQGKPLIMDLDSQQTNLISPVVSGISPVVSGRNLISEISSSKNKIPEPSYKIKKEPSEGDAEYLVAEIALPQLKVAAGMTLDIGGDRILLKTRANIYELDIYLPYEIIQEDVGAQFNRETKMLTITMPVEKS